jgi:hypothetical protein
MRSGNREGYRQTELTAVRLWFTAQEPRGISYGSHMDGLPCSFASHKMRIYRSMTTSKMIYNTTVLTSQGTRHVFTTEPNQLMLCGETVAVCRENRTEHTDTHSGQSVPHRRHRYSVLAECRVLVSHKMRKVQLLGWV